MNSVKWSVLAVACCLGGCANTQNSVVAATGTTIGVELGTQQGTGAPTGVLGYRRAEFAHVPTNRTKEGGSGSEVKQVADVVMELHYGGVLSSNGSIYQRLAVGTEAVTAPSAAVMFARAPDASVDASTAAALANANVTVTNADKVATCTVKGGRLDTERMKKILDRVDAGNSAGAVSSYKSLLSQPLPEQALRALLKQSAPLAQALADNTAPADCAQ